MNITDVKIRKTFEDGPLKAVLSITFDDCLALHDVKIISVENKTFVVMPSRKNNDGAYKDIVHPINSEFRKILELEVMEEYNRYLAEMLPDGEIQFLVT